MATMIPAGSGKFARLAELCEEIASRQEKMLVFTQFREITDPLAAFLAQQFGRPGLVLHGGTPVKQRKQRVDEFQDENGPPFFILSLKAGGTGLNLTAASHVVHFDRWWNPAVENQATDRAFRIGQRKNVLVHKFVCQGTVEEKIDALITEKTALAGEILQGGAEILLTEMNNDELLKLVSLDVNKVQVLGGNRRCLIIGWRPYVPVAKRREKANREMQKRLKKGVAVEPVEIQGRKIARTFWGQAWCDHLEQFSDYANRLPRGQTYVRNGSVCHLSIEQGKVEAIVSGTELYNVSIDISPLSSAKWKNIREQCTGQIGSMLELLQGRLSSKIMQIVTEPAKGLFPQPRDIKLHCDCPDWADMCKHVAAVLYGVGARLDDKPELLFKLRKVDHEELISAELDMQTATTGQGKRRRLADRDLANLFGIEIEDATPPAKKKRASPRKTEARSKPKKSVKKKTAARA